MKSCPTKSLYQSIMYTVYLQRAFFDACDGIYLNYNWNDEKLNLSKEMAKNRQFDVYVGVDVFGRGCFGGGGINTGLVFDLHFTSILI
jgi:mannosyl-glycoprotein endo-beta-N-acetylglucosaminidase